MFQKIADYTAKQQNKEQKEDLQNSFNSQRIWNILFDKI